MYNREKEVREAINAGQRALDSLYLAERKMSNASDWGFLDLLGGKWFSGLMKHSNLSDAAVLLRKAKREVEQFRSELGDIRDIPDLSYEIGDFLTFADFFWDGPIADILVQSRIRDCRRKIDDATLKIERIIRELKQYV
ncbi:MAG: hypothetical protein Q4D71_05920 [Oscillospiraceae bacterium]|nr:hypothetical protein [Oscillospiraceae bacterium]